MLFDFVCVLKKLPARTISTMSRSDYILLLVLNLLNATQSTNYFMLPFPLSCVRFCLLLRLRTKISPIRRIYQVKPIAKMHMMLIKRTKINLHINKTHTSQTHSHKVRLFSTSNMLNIISCLHQERAFA